MKIERRWVVDTNVLISRLLSPQGALTQALQCALGSGDLLMSDATWAELADVIMRPKFDRYITVELRQEFLSILATTCEHVPVTRSIRACRDPRDDKFLEVAVNGRADALITGDTDLLALHPFHAIPILTPAQYIDWMESDRISSSPRY